MNIEREIDDLLAEAVGKEPAQRALEAVAEHAQELGEQNVETIETVFDHYGTALRYLRHHRDEAG